MVDFCDKAIGKVLFIDEAYSLSNHGDTRAIDALTDALTKDDYKGKMAVVLAGYSSDMNQFLETNKGLNSRFPNQIHFDDYSSEELWQVLLLHAKQNNLVLHEDCHPYAVEYFNRKKKEVREGFGNAREAENLLRSLRKQMRKRKSKQNSSTNIIMPEDFESYGRIDPSKVKIGSADTRSPMEKLDGLKGVEKLKEQFNKYVRDYRYYKEHPQSTRFRPHMAFVGNPGTGKTTVARIFGEILREEHLLPTGNFVEVKKEDLTRGHVGGTAEQTKAKCKEARGGIMFIDEAHQLYEGKDEHGYGKEALKVILTELESREDTLYIFAGYTAEMNEFLDKADPGLRSRVTNIFEFEDYKPDTLLTILRSKLVGMQTTPDFDKTLSLVVKNIYDKRNPFTFGNARDMERIAGEIQSEYLSIHNGQGPLDTDCIPARYMRTLREMTQEEENAIMSELNSLQGLSNVKRTLRKLTQDAKGMRMKVQRGVAKEMPLQNLTFLFMGNPGTGKTTVAQLMGKILCGYGLLSSDEVNIYTKDQIVSKYVGDTQKNVTEMFNASFGRVLFIDEAYMLAKDEHGKEALDQITANMTNPAYLGKLAIVMAGYTKDIMDMLNANSGLPSRFAHKVIFDDYSNDELWQILSSNISKQGLIIDEHECKPYADAYWDKERRSGANFGNVRTCNNLLSEITSRQNCRIASAGNDIDDTALITILPEDFPNYEEVTMMQFADAAQQLTQEISTPSYASNELIVDCSLNNPDQKVRNVKDLDYAVGLIHSAMGEGTGFIVSLKQRYILTCSHVIENGSSFEFRMLSGEFITHARVIWNNYEQDMALMEVAELPADARYLQLDNAIDQNPEKLTKLILCGYPDGSAFASGVSLVEGAINNYEKQHAWNDRCFDTIYANVSATHGCSGGPVVRSEDLSVIGLLQGGKEGGEIQFITDIHQLFSKINIKS
jgi:SpoVK/Ycf46/Vps4 family AAA+-type ATPase